MSDEIQIRPFQRDSYHTLRRFGAVFFGPCVLALLLAAYGRERVAAADEPNKPAGASKPRLVEVQRSAPKIPPSDENLTAGLNWNAQGVLERVAKGKRYDERVVIDITALRTFGPKFKEAFEQVWDALPNAEIRGTYLSSMHNMLARMHDPTAADDFDYFPIRCLPVCMPDAAPWDFEHSAAQRAAHQEAWEKEVRRRFAKYPRLNCLFSDNAGGLPTSSYGWRDMGWDAVCQLQRERTKILHELGIAHIINMAGDFISMTEEQAKLLARSADGVTQELWLRPRHRDDPAKVEYMMKMYRTLLDGGCAVFLVPGFDFKTLEDDERDAAVAAGFIMLLREPGDALYVTHAFWQPEPAYRFWPQQLGAARGPYRKQRDSEGVWFVRDFANGTVAVNFARDAVRVTPRR